MRFDFIGITIYPSLKIVYTRRNDGRIILVRTNKLSTIKRLFTIGVNKPQLMVTQRSGFA